jgi:hypothetical protein
MAEQKSGQAPHTPALQLRIVDRDGRLSLSITGVPRHARLAIVPTDVVERAATGQQVAGRFSGDEQGVTFHPAFPLTPGMRYSLVVDGAEAAYADVPERTAVSTTEILAMYPTAHEVPLNLLRVYCTFSAPMSEGSARDSVRVMRCDTGEQLEGALLDMDPELWDRQRRRLTLLLDPGRIKRGLGPNIQAGYPLDEGMVVSVQVDRSFRDAAGQSLRRGAERRYRVGPAVRQHVDPLVWRVDAPPAGSRRALAVRFDRPLDRALLDRCLAVVDEAKVPIAGRVSAEDGEQLWRFTPATVWRAAPYSIRVDARLEDVAGNSVRRVFDRDLERAEDEPRMADLVEIPFVVS